MNDIRFSTIEEAIEAIKKGEIVIVVDDEDRENEGDFIAAADLITSESINFMATHGRGLICVPMAASRCKEINLHKMVSDNTDPLGTAFTVSVDLKGNGVTTGISASDRAKTVLGLVDKNIKASDFSRPGHIFPLIAKDGGVLRRTGHTEAAVDLTRLAGLSPAGVIVEILNEDGTMARLPQLSEIANKFNIKLINIEQLVAYRLKHDSLIDKKITTDIQTPFGDFLMHVYEQTNNQKVHFALTKGNWEIGDQVLTRINSMNSTQDILNLLSNKNEDSIGGSFNKIKEADNAVILFIDSEIHNPIAKIKQQLSIIEDTYKDTDNRDFGIGAQILHDLRVCKIKLLSNSEHSKRIGMTGYGLEITALERF